MATEPSSQFAYGAEIVRCHACATSQRTVRKFVDEGGDQAGVLARMTRTPEE